MVNWGHMSLSIGIVGLPNVGKSTLFNALTNSEILAANYPFATIEPNTGIVPVPDDRLKTLQTLYGSQKLIPATVKFTDIAGLVAGAADGEGLGNTFLANIRECDAIAHIVRAFDNDDILRHDQAPTTPARDIETITTELALADIQSIEKQLPKLAKDAKRDAEARATVEQLEKLKTQLEAGDTQYAADHADQFRPFNLLTTKPVIYVFNLGENELDDTDKQRHLAELVAPSQAVFVSAKLEEELRGLEPGDAEELLESYGVKSSGLEQLVHAAYTTLGLQSYLTAGPKEVRAWTIPRGATAPEAAGVIHTDFERGFIAAQVVDFDDLVAAGSEQAAKAAGRVRTEGKDYRMQPGDVVEFRFNV